jgi:hypothetical protein
MTRHTQAGRPGSIIPLVAISLIALIGMTALAVDIGLISVSRTQAQASADVGALAGARALTGDDATQNNVANAIVIAKNSAISSTTTDGNPVVNIKMTTSQVTATPNVYTYDPTAQHFTITYPAPGTRPPGQAWSAMTVAIGYDPNNLLQRTTFFGKIFGINNYNVTAIATAVHRPRDIAFVLDFSGSMRFGSVTSYPSVPSTVTGSLNPDQRIPAFGPWSTQNSVLQRTTDYASGAYVYAVNNQTMDSSFNGPRVISDFYTKAGGTGALSTAFDNPAQTDTAYSSTAAPVTPAPSSFATQSGAVAYDGDRWPLDSRATTGTAYSSTVLGFLIGTPTSAGTLPSGTTLSNLRVTVRTNVQGTLGAGTTYAPSTLTSIAPIPTKTGTVSVSSSNYPVTFVEPVNPALPDQDEGYGRYFKGYAMGPAYYGKTFYYWPPDPRYDPLANPLSPGTAGTATDSNGKWMGDWRKRFFMYGNSTARMDDNSLLWNSTGVWQAAGSGTYQVDYKAVLAWIKSGPQTLPANLRSGRVLFYASIPSDVDTSSGSADDKMDKFFWKNYIDYVLGTNLGGAALGNWGDKRYGLDGVNASQTFGTTHITAKSALTASVDPDTGLATGPKPYMRYDDNPIHPRLHFWFGPQTMLDFLAAYNAYQFNWWPGTCHEAHCWHLKAGIQSAFNDIEKNHPNDWASLIYFSSHLEYFTPRVTLGRNYPRMKNALWYPFTNTNNGGSTPGSFLDLLDGGDTGTEIRPYDSGWNSTSKANIPNANGGTDPQMGFMAAYNQLSSRSASPGPFNGRHGASKVVVFETDGVPNTTCDGAFMSSGAYNSYYTTPTSTTFLADNDPAAQSAGLAVVSQITALDTAPNPGYSSIRNPARVHAIAFGQLFETVTPTSTGSLQFLLHVQQNGNTSSASDTSIESYKIITGDYNTRIDKIRQALMRIMQSGVQVSLIQ